MCRLLDNGLSCVYSDSTEIVSLDSPHIYAVETTPLGLSNIDRQSSTMMHVDSLIIIFCHAIANGVTVKRYVDISQIVIETIFCIIVQMQSSIFANIES
jgi:hypothetical protein